MENLKKILFLCDASDIDVVKASFAEHTEYQLTVETAEKILRFEVRAYLEQTIRRILKNPDMYDGVVGTHDSSAVFAAIIAQETGKRFASVDSIINCQNKYLCRRIQREFVPEHAPVFELGLDYLRNPSTMPIPFFIKPVRSNISFGAHKIEKPEQLEYYIARDSFDIARFNQYYLDALSSNVTYHNALNIATCNTFLCEGLIEGTQVTVDGYVFEGEVCSFGITKAFYYPGTNSFFYHAFPWKLSPELSEKIEKGLGRLIPKLGIDNSFFNVELRIDEKTDTFKIIEVNSRIAFQFAKTIESVIGYDPLHMLCDVAVGKKPGTEPSVRKTFEMCYNFELHHFNDAMILETPTQSAYEEMKLKYPEVVVRNLVHENANLSDFKHNPESYRYGVMDIPGNSHEEIMKKYEEVVAILGYRFGKPIDKPVNIPAGFEEVQRGEIKGESHLITAQPTLRT